jgi:hypothetical protein
VLGRVTHALGPVRTNELVVGADPAGGDDHRLPMQLEVVDLNA